MFPKIKSFQLKELPIPIVSDEIQKEIIDLVDELLNLKENDINADTSKLEVDIDLLITGLYQVNDDIVVGE